MRAHGRFSDTTEAAERTGSQASEELNLLESYKRIEPIGYREENSKCVE